MENVLLGRQPIFGADMHVLGYELLFRATRENAAVITDGDRATADVLNRCTEFGLQDLVGSHLAFVNFGRNFLLSGYCEALPHQQAVLEVLETVEADPEILNRLKELRSRGYRVALDDFGCAESAFPLLRVADFVKVDILATPEAQLKKNVIRMRKFPVRIIAEKVETREQFQLCQDAGFDYFQGYFFCRPDIIRRRSVPVSRLATIQLITKLNDPDLPMKQLEATITQDVSLTYKLLLYVNSVVCGLQRQVESIGHAAMMIGHAKLKIWASLILFSRLEDKPPDLIITGLVRARMCEHIAQALKVAQTDRCFLAGLFSVLDAILDQPLDTVLSGLPLTPDIKDALLEQKGRFGHILRCVMAYERQEWKDTNCGHLDHESLRKTYVEAMTSVLQAFGTITQEPKTASTRSQD
jgi:EAL and modified HD-GYP domain-containing signal transduction protein